jgi:hypothetical protein
VMRGSGSEVRAALRALPNDGRPRTGKADDGRAHGRRGRPAAGVNCVWELPVVACDTVRDPPARQRLMRSLGPALQRLGPSHFWGGVSRRAGGSTAGPALLGVPACGHIGLPSLVGRSQPEQSAVQVAVGRRESARRPPLPEAAQRDAVVPDDVRSVKPVRRSLLCTHDASRPHAPLTGAAEECRGIERLPWGIIREN